MQGFYIVCGIYYIERRKILKLKVKYVKMQK